MTDLRQAAQAVVTAWKAGELGLGIKEFSALEASLDGQQAAPIRCAKPSLSCPNMKDRENDTSMSYEHYDCKVCGGHIALDYDDMR